MKAEEQDQGGSPYGHRGESRKRADRSRRDAAGKASLEQILTESDCTAFVRLSLRFAFVSRRAVRL